jgi:phosphoadenosine phosphosulfate reductase
MQRALDELGITAWLAGLRAGQTEHRATLRPVERQGSRYKIHPILRWTSKQVHEYLVEHELPYHPLVDEGYTSIGDWHSTRAVGEGEDERAGRFGGLRQECGIHLPTSHEEDQSREASGL